MTKTARGMAGNGLYADSILARRDAEYAQAAADAAAFKAECEALRGGRSIEELAAEWRATRSPIKLGRV